MKGEEERIKCRLNKKHYKSRHPCLKFSFGNIGNISDTNFVVIKHVTFQCEKKYCSQKGGTQHRHTNLSNNYLN